MRLKIRFAPAKPRSLFIYFFSLHNSSSSFFISHRFLSLLIRFDSSTRASSNDKYLFLLPLTTVDDKKLSVRVIRFICQVQRLHSRPLLPPFFSQYNFYIPCETFIKTYVLANLFKLMNWDLQHTAVIHVRIALSDSFFNGIC